ncbi:MAG: DNA repair exonuclease [Fimbriimonadales bacterium]|nr:DNA repair exonuclease [Fimbriimonadales bacterium]
MLRIAHTADVHLGRAFGYLGEAASAHQERLKRSFRRVFAESQARGCHAVLIAGDLFDSSRVGRRWMEFALSTIAETRLPVIVIPGNHDPAEAHPFREARLPPNLHFLPDTTRLRLDTLDLEVVTCPAGDEARWQPALRRDPNGAPFQIALMHGSMPNAGGQGDIQPQWIGASGLDYIALGDWHSPQEWTQGSTVCYYSGAPEMIMPRQQLPAVMLIAELAPGQPARVERVITGEARYPDGAHDGTLEWDIAPYATTLELLTDLRSRLTPETVATIRLVGRWRSAEPLSVQLLAENLQPHCLWLELESAFQPELLQPHTPFEAMLTEIAQERAAQEPAQASLYYEAAQTALYLLRGGRL